MTQAYANGEQTGRGTRRCHMAVRHDRPNGHRYDNRMEFLEVVPNEKLVLDHGTNKENDPNLARS